MMKNYTKSIIMMVVALAAFVITAQSQVTITKWTFEGDVTTPSTGSGTASLIGGTTATFANGLEGGVSGGRAWNSAAYPAQGEGSGTAGVEYMVSTSGYTNITVSWDGRHSNTSANRLRLQYTLNGSDWINYNADASNAINDSAGVAKGFDNGRYKATAGDTWYQRSASFAAISGANDNASFGIRLVSEFFDGLEYAAATSASAYSPNGTLRYDNVTFTGGAGNSAMITSTPGNLIGFTYVETNGPSESQSILLNGFNLDPAVGTITLTPSLDFEISVNVTDYVDSYEFIYENGEFSNTTIYVRMKDALVTGSYNGTLTISGGGAPDVIVNLSGSVTSTTPVSISSITLPMYMQGAVPNTIRVPFAYFATLNNLLPNATYRYYNKVVLASDAPEYNGAGNCIFVNTLANTFTRTMSTSLGTAGEYGEFATDAGGVYSGWFMTEPTGNASRFKPGTELFVRIILNDGASGTTEATRLTSSEGVKVLGFYENSADSTGTAIRGTSSYTPKNFVFLFDNTQGTGRPLYGTQVEGTAIDFAGSSSYAAFYTENVAGSAGAWGGIVPNINANGVKRVEEHSIENGTLKKFNISENGVWGTVDTKNPSGGTTTVLVINTPLGIGSPVSQMGRIYAYGKVLKIELENEVDGIVQVLNLNGQNVAGFNLNGNHATFTTDLPDGIYFVRFISNQGTATAKVFIR
ncbi:MAG: T9SS type A sorting domain-containing protein [Bacteroidota bacterium]